MKGNLYRSSEAEKKDHHFVDQVAGYHCVFYYTTKRKAGFEAVLSLKIKTFNCESVFVSPWAGL